RPRAPRPAPRDHGCGWGCSPRARRYGPRTGLAVAAVSGGTLGRELVAVVPEEELLERGRLAHQAADAVAGEVAEDGVQVRRVDVEPGGVTVEVQVVDARELGESR